MSYKKIAIIILVLLLSSLLFSACAPGASLFKNTVDYVDGLGRTVKIPSQPERIISLSPSNTEILFAVGAGKQVVGRDEFSDYPEEAKAIASIGGSMGKINMEQIVALKPDLVLAAEINTPEQVKAIEDLGFAVYYLSNPKDMNGLFKNLQLVGDMTGNRAEAKTLVNSLTERVKQATASLDASHTPKVFYELDGTDPAKPWTTGKGSFVDVLLTMAGAANVASSAGEGWMQISQEALIDENPAIILLGDAAYGTTPEAVSQRAGWDSILAVQTNSIFPFDDNLVSRPGPRLVDGLEALVKILHTN